MRALRAVQAGSWRAVCPARCGMRRVLAFVLLLAAAGCAAPSDSPAPAPSAPEPTPVGPLGAAQAIPDPGPLEPCADDFALDFTPSDPIGEAEESVSWQVVLLGACMLAGALAAEYGCKRHLLHELCPPGTVITRTVRDTMDKNKTATVRIPCDVLETMVCGTGAFTAGEVMHHMCAGIL